MLYHSVTMPYACTNPGCPHGTEINKKTGAVLPAPRNRFDPLCTKCQEDGVTPPAEAAAKVAAAHDHHRVVNRGGDLVCPQRTNRSYTAADGLSLYEKVARDFPHLYPNGIGVVGDPPINLEPEKPYPHSHRYWQSDANFPKGGIWVDYGNILRWERWAGDDAAAFFAMAGDKAKEIQQVAAVHGYKDAVHSYMQKWGRSTAEAMAALSKSKAKMLRFHAEKMIERLQSGEGTYEGHLDMEYDNHSHDSLYLKGLKRRYWQAAFLLVDSETGEIVEWIFMTTPGKEVELDELQWKELGRVLESAREAGTPIITVNTGAESPAIKALQENGLLGTNTGKNGGYYDAGCLDGQQMLRAVIDQTKFDPTLENPLRLGMDVQRRMFDLPMPTEEFWEDAELPEGMRKAHNALVDVFQQYYLWMAVKKATKDLDAAAAPTRNKAGKAKRKR